MARRPSRFPRIAVVVVAVVVALVVGVYLGGHSSWLPSGLRGTFTDDSQGHLVQDALNIISHDYFRPVKKSDLVNTGLTAAVASLNDPYSHYLDPSNYGQFQNQSNPHVARGGDRGGGRSARTARDLESFPGRRRRGRGCGPGT